MNPDRIYRQYRDEALAKQIIASEYTTFVAMPFRDQFSYRSHTVYRDVIQEAAECANNKIQEAAECANNKRATLRNFAQPTRADDHPGTARVITEEIIVQILESHIVLADLTFENAGVLLETGIAFGMKPNPQIILITQGKLSDLHFDIRNNTVLSYNAGDSVGTIADAFIAAATAFEDDKNKYISSITQTLSPDAIACLKHYGTIQQLDPAKSLHAGVACNVFSDGRSNERFDAGTRDLLHARLIRTEWKVNAIEGKDAFGMHATDLGWAVIAQVWNELKRPEK